MKIIYKKGDHVNVLDLSKVCLIEIYNSSVEFKVTDQAVFIESISLNRILNKEDKNKLALAFAKMKDKDAIYFFDEFVDKVLGKVNK